MLSVKGIYENGKVRLLEPVLGKKRAKVIVTISITENNGWILGKPCCSYY